MVAVYLHGFASSPESSKAAFFADRFAEAGVPFVCPDLNTPLFSTLTVTRMLGQLDEQLSELPADDIVLIGSSLGGFVAVEAAARHADRARPIARLILLAPAVELEWNRWSEVGPGGIDRWRTDGVIEVFHYGLNRPEHLAFSFYEDASRYDPASRLLSLPMLIFQGRHDESVSPANVERFAHRQPSAALHLLEDGHQLKNSLPYIWQEIARFIS